MNGAWAGSRRAALRGALLMALLMALLWPLAALAQAGEDVMAPPLSATSPHENWQFIVAAALPGLIALLTRQTWNQAAKSAAAFGISAVVVLVGMYLDGTLLQGGFDAIATPLKVFPLVIAFYYGLWKPMGASGAIHEATG